MDKNHYNSKPFMYKAILIFLFVVIPVGYQSNKYFGIHITLFMLVIMVPILIGLGFLIYKNAMKMNGKDDLDFDDIKKEEEIKDDSLSTLK